MNFTFPVDSDILTVPFWMNFTFSNQLRHLTAPSEWTLPLQSTQTFNRSTLKELYLSNQLGSPTQIAKVPSDPEWTVPFQSSQTFNCPIFNKHYHSNQLRQVTVPRWMNFTFPMNSDIWPFHPQRTLPLQSTQTLNRPTSMNFTFPINSFNRPTLSELYLSSQLRHLTVPPSTNFTSPVNPDI